jgi:hypothetical protein
VNLTQMLALSQIQELERDMRARQQRHELAMTRSARPATRRVLDRVLAFAGASHSRTAVASSRGIACTTC